MTFKEWIRRYEDSNNETGDLARDIAADDNFPDIEEYGSLILGYIHDNGWTSAAMRTFTNLFNIYRKQADSPQGEINWYRCPKCNQKLFKIENGAICKKVFTKCKSCKVIIEIKI